MFGSYVDSTRVLVLLVLDTITTACAKRTGTAASVKRMRRKLDRAISPELLACGSASLFRACTHSAKKENLVELVPLDTLNSDNVLRNFFISVVLLH